MSFGSARVMWSTLRVRDLIKKFTNKKINISKKETKEDTEEIKEDTEETKEVEYYSTDKKCLVTIKIPSHMTILKKSNNHTNNIHTYSLDHCYKHEKRIEEAHSGDFEENFKKRNLHIIIIKNLTRNTQKLILTMLIQIVSLPSQSSSLVKVPLPSQSSSLVKVPLPSQSSVQLIIEIKMVLTLIIRCSRKDQITTKSAKTL